MASTAAQLVDEREHLKALLSNDFPYYALNCLMIRPKVGGRPVPFQLNRVQLHIHRLFEQQRHLTGMVRALILKARQQGSSTYVEGRYFHKVSLRRGIKAFILTHEGEATKNLFEMAERFYNNLPKMVKPQLGHSNARELSFDRLDSGYAVATAGTKEAGRSQTAQLFHGSEVGFWENAKDHMTGVGQIVAEAPGTEIVLESTANGPSGMFHEMWQAAEEGKTPYLPIFAPWFWSGEYTTEPPAGFEFDRDERELQALYHWTDGQLFWRNQKIAGFLGDENRFQQEYPSNAAEAFVLVGHEPFVDVAAVTRARKREEVEGRGPRILGVDPARFGDDRTALTLRQGRKVHWIKWWRKLGTDETADRVAKLLSEGDIDKVFVDVVGIGAGVVDQLHRMGFKEMVIGVAGSERPRDPELYFNKRAECWGDMKDWIASIEAPCSLPEMDDLQTDLTAPQFRYREGNRLLIESKEDMKKRGVRSPDLADALALTFAQHVFDHAPNEPGIVVPAPRRIVRPQRDWRTR